MNLQDEIIIGLNEWMNRKLDLRNRNQTAWRAAFSLLYPIAYKTAKSVRINLNDADAEEAAGQALSELVIVSIR